MRDNPPAPQQTMGPVSPSPSGSHIQQGQPSLYQPATPVYTRDGYSYYNPPNPIEHTPLSQWFKLVTSPKPSAPQPSPAQQYTGSSFSADLKKMVSEPAPVSGSYQSRPGGEIKVATQAQQADLLKQGSRQWIESHEVTKTIEQTPYLKEFGYKPAQGVYVKEIADVTSRLSQQQEQLSKIQNAQIGTTFTIGGKTYTKEEATTYYNKNIRDLTVSKQQLQKYQEAGYEIKKTDEGYTFQYPKASEVYTSIHEKELSGVALTSASFIKSPLAIGTLASGIQYAITGDEKVRQAELESLSEFALGLDISIKKGEYIQKIATSPAMIEGVYLPVALMTGTAVIGVAGKGATMLGGRLAETAIGSKVVSGAEFIGTKLSPITRPLISIGTKISTTVAPVAESFIGKQAIKYGAFGAMAFLPENPITGKGLYKTITEAPEQAGSALGQSLFGWEVGWGAMEAGRKIPQQIREMNIGERLGLRPMGTETSQPIFGAMRPSDITGRVQSFNERLGLRPMGEGATQPLPGAKRLLTKGMTEEERFAFEYKEPPLKITAEERESEALARSLEKKKPSRVQEFIKSEEGTQPLLGIRPSNEFSIGEKRGFEDLVKNTKTSQPIPGIKPKELGTAPRKEVFFSEEAGRTTTVDIYEPYPKAQVLTEKTGRGTATTIEELPRIGELQIGEVSKPGTRLEIPASYEKKVTQLGAGKQRLDLIEAQPGQPTGKLIAEESKKGTLTKAEFKPGERQQFEGLMGVRRVRPTSTLPYPGEGAGNLFESMPGTKAEAIKSQELIHKPYDISLRPKYKTQGEAIEKIQSYYGEPAKPTSLTGAEPVSEKGAFAIDTKAEENIFYKEISGAEGKKDYVFDLGKTGVVKKEAVVVNVKGQTKVFTGEQLRVLGKGELKARPQRFTEEQLKKAVYSPGASPEYFGKQLRKTMRVKTDTSVPVGTRPETGWAKYLGERQEAKIFIEKPKEYPLPKLESEVTTKATVIPRPGKTSLRYPKQESVLNKKAGEEIKPFTVEGESIGRQSYIIETKPVSSESFKPSGLYESPELNTGWSSIYAKQPSMKEVYEMEKGTGMASSRWERIKPGGRITREPFSTETYKTGLHLLSGGIEARPEGEGLLTALGSTFLGKTKPGLIDKEGFGEMTTRISGLGELNEPMQGQPNINDFMNKLKYIDLTKQGSRQAQRQASLQTTKQLTDQLQEQELITDQATIFDTGYDTTPDVIPDIIPDGIGNKYTWRPPPRKKKEEETPEKKYLKETKPDESYDVYVKERSMYEGKIRKPTRFTRVNRGPLSYKDALSLGGEVTDTTSAISFRLKKTKGTPEKPDRQVQDFSSRAQKFTQRGDTIIEKAEYRMDTPGEIQGISALGWSKRRKQNKTTNGLFSTNIRTHQNNSKGLRSTKNGLMNNVFFKKKKNGGKKDAYY
jgi:hypothetical protein